MPDGAAAAPRPPYRRQAGRNATWNGMEGKPAGGFLRRSELVESATSEQHCRPSVDSDGRRGGRGEICLGVFDCGVRLLFLAAIEFGEGGREGEEVVVRARSRTDIHRSTHKQRRVRMLHSNHHMPIFL
jgi:hypothetical protein